MARELPRRPETLPPEFGDLERKDVYRPRRDIGPDWHTPTGSRSRNIDLSHLRTRMPQDQRLRFLNRAAVSKNMTPGGNDASNRALK